MFNYVFILLLFLGPVSAQEVDLRVEPEQPIMDETFELVFSIKTPSEARPYISFNPGHASVQGRESRGVSISTRIVNGQFTTERTLKYAYQIVTDRSGPLYIRDIVVELDGRDIELEPVRINVLRESPQPRDIFLQADVSKTDVYVGEGVDVRYYLFYRTSIVGREIEQFPRLDNFTKRFHMPGRDSVDTVEFQGRVYRRMLVYGARLFPQREGTVHVDPMTVKVQYTRERPGSSPFGMRSREYATRSVRSRPVEVSVKNLPGDNVPTSFRGLVGEHTFTLSSVREKNLVNEPIEVTLSVEGGGALEEFSAPSLYEADFLEEFDRQSSLTETSFSEAKKTFEYVYLGRAPGEIENEQFRYSYFDPETEEYYEFELDLPNVVVDGAAGTTVATDSADDDREELLERDVIRVVRTLVAPNFRDSGIFSAANYLTLFNIFLGGGLLLLLGFESRTFISPHLQGYRVKFLLKKMSREGVGYDELYRLVMTLGEKEHLVGGLKEIISKSSLDEESKGYFLRLVDDCENRTFSGKNYEGKAKLEQKYAQKLLNTFK